MLQGRQDTLSPPTHPLGEVASSFVYPAVLPLSPRGWVGLAPLSRL